MSFARDNIIASQSASHYVKTSNDGLNRPRVCYVNNTLMCPLSDCRG